MFVESSTLDLVLRTIVLSSFGLLWVVGLVRLVGLRSFSKMSSFDFVMTVAMGSLLAGAAQAVQWSSFVQTLGAMSMLFAVQYLIAKLRFAFDLVEDVIENQPILLLKDGVVYDQALAATRVTRRDLLAKLREANVTNIEDVKAVVLETTGDISVIQGDDPLSEQLLDGVNKSIESPQLKNP